MVTFDTFSSQNAKKRQKEHIYREWNNNQGTGAVLRRQNACQKVTIAILDSVH